MFKIQNILEIKNSSDVSKILTDCNIEFKDNLNEIRLNCPREQHRKSPNSLSFNNDKKLFKCHACDYEGDIFNFVECVKKIKFTEAVEFVAKSSGIEVKYIPAVKTNLTEEEYQKSPTEVLNGCKNLVSHDYLKEKKVEVCKGLYEGLDNHKKSSVIVPFSNVENELQTLHYVHKGYKGFLKNHSYKDSFFILDNKTIEDGDTVYIAEGIATALTIWMALGKDAKVISYGSVGNMSNTVKVLTNKYPKAQIIICLDRGDAPKKQAKILEDESNCRFVIPCFNGLKYQEEPNDFNDIVSKCKSDLNEVRNQLEAYKTFDDIYKTSSQVKQPSLEDEYQEEIINYLAQKNVDELNPERFHPCFFTGIHRTIIESINKTWEQGLGISIGMISLNSGDQAERVYYYLEQLSTKPIISHTEAELFLAKLKNKYVDTKLEKAHDDISNSNKPITEKFKLFNKELESVQVEYEDNRSLAELKPDLLRELSKTGDACISTGFTSLNRLLGGGFKEGEVTVLTGGAGAGKTAFTVQLCDNAAKDGAAVVYVSMEMQILKLMERSFKRLSRSSKLTDEEINKANKLHEEFAENIFMMQGKSGMLLAKVRSKVLRIKIKRPTQPILLIIDPFQRLGTENDKHNETEKVNYLMSEVKEMAAKLKIHIFVISDTTKGHQASAGEGSGRGSYMIDHACDNMMYLRKNRDPLMALYGSKKEKDKEVPAIPDGDPFAESVKGALRQHIFTNELGTYRLKSPYSTYVALIASKVRDSARFSPLFVYEPQYHSFTDTELWDDILSQEKSN
jgi:replicative DNA helicase/phage/plasmid primase-like uncharacterized protein